MPIYEYSCNSCGAEKEHLQKVSDAPIAACPVCGSSNYVKRISAAGFQLKGSGWYVTDFKNNKSKPADNTTATKDNAQTATTPSKESSAKNESKPASTATVE